MAVESYKEGVLEMNGVYASMEKIFEIAKYKSTIWVNISDIEYFKTRSLTTNDLQRIEKVDLKYPIIIVKDKSVTKKPYVFVDGRHRLLKAERLGKKVILAKVISLMELQSCVITKEEADKIIEEQNITL
jgi:hypothetical protein